MKMVLFGQSTPFDAEIEKATCEKNTNENWSLILDVCDKVSLNPRSAKECLKAIMKRIGHSDPHVAMQAITLLDACVSNCGKPFHLEIASRDFENEFRRLLAKAHSKVSLKMRQMLKNWAENDFKTDPELNLIPSLYTKLRHEGYDFSNLNEKPKSMVKAAALKDPNVVSSQQEEDDIAKAIELSLNETKNSPKHPTGSSSSSSNSGATASASASAYPSLYPSFGGTTTAVSASGNNSSANTTNTSQAEARKVRALYDFEAAEENELTFFAGEILHVLDDSDANWWKGFNQRGEGLFPSNFVTDDLSVDPELLDINQQQKKNVKFEDDARELREKTESAAAAAANQRIEIDEAKIDRLLHLLHEANPEDPSQDSDEMLRLEQEIHQMGPLIDAELERVDRKHAQLTQLSADLVEAFNLYHSLMRDDRSAIGPIAGPMHSLPYQGTPMSQQMLYGPAGYPGATGGGGFTTQPSQMPQNFGMSSLPSMPNAQNVPMSSMPTIPMQFQNGHANAPPQFNGVTITGGQQQQHQLYIPPRQQSGHPQQQQQQQQQQQPQQQQQQPPPEHTQPNYQMLHQQQQPQYLQQPQTNAAGVPPPSHNVAAAPTTTTTAIAQHQSFMPYMQQPQQQQQQQQQQPQQFALMPNGPQSFITSAPPSIQPPSAMLPHNNNHHNNMNNNNATQSMEQFSQLQQQMAAMTMGMNQAPVPMPQVSTQNFSVQNDMKNNIPIYQQQR